VFEKLQSGPVRPRCFRSGLRTGPFLEVSSAVQNPCQTFWWSIGFRKITFGAGSARKLPKRSPGRTGLGSERCCAKAMCDCEVVGPVFEKLQSGPVRPRCFRSGLRAGPFLEVSSAVQNPCQTCWWSIGFRKITFGTGSARKLPKRSPSQTTLGGERCYAKAMSELEVAARPPKSHPRGRFGQEAFKVGRARGAFYRFLVCKTAIPWMGEEGE
jgi:hypothetical protein